MDGTCVGTKPSRRGTPRRIVGVTIVTVVAFGLAYVQTVEKAPDAHAQDWWCQAGIVFETGAVVAGSGAPSLAWEAAVFWAGGAIFGVGSCLQDIWNSRAPIATGCGALRQVHNATTAVLDWCDYWDWYRGAYPYEYGWNNFHRKYGSAKEWYSRKRT